ncbi:hypothetical protein ZHAS_00000525 [Anopheles sinensis]|uniref:Uncharacterized protein n=1 Tax=Anopheles sinensis TaxID=74873 RepID=A0A084VA76_ANOSI|nr:hypothetical protein ZHAS_00000525 [Anopheles sinensis]
MLPVSKELVSLSGNILFLPDAKLPFSRGHPERNDPDGPEKDGVLSDRSSSVMHVFGDHHHTEPSDEGASVENFPEFESEHPFAPVSSVRISSPLRSEPSGKDPWAGPFLASGDGLLS